MDSSTDKPWPWFHQSSNPYRRHLMILFDTLVGGQAESQQSHCLFYQNKTKKTCPFLCQTKDIQKKKGSSIQKSIQQRKIRHIWNLISDAKLKKVKRSRGNIIEYLLENFFGQWLIDLNLNVIITAKSNKT